MASPIERGDVAPGFTLRDHHNEECTLGEFAGRRVLLSFHPLAWTRVCGKQMKALEENYERLGALNTVPVGISVDAVPTKHAWAKELGIKRLRLLSDFWPHGGVAALYRLFRDEQGFTERANVVIDEDGSVALCKVYDVPELPDLEEIIDFLTGTR
jgi:peroxiredoxin